ncbi:MAG TPA: hypothetical protein VLA56_00115 [Pseudomonadales bacterium]|nr:hypothetical protein [Pseudomonadales bacterium]
MASEPDALADLFDAALPLAEQMLQRFESFYPYAIVRMTDGSIEPVLPAEEDDYEGAPLIELLRELIGVMVSTGDITGSALVFDALVRCPETDALQDAIAVELGDGCGDLRLACVPYVVADGEVALGPVQRSM